jgi:lipopolysaccharide biosynthesis glycosyltransferase
MNFIKRLLATPFVALLGITAIHAKAPDVQNVHDTKDATPAFKENNILVVFASDENYSMYLGVAIRSLIDNSSKNNNYDIWVLDSGISDENKKVILSLIGDRQNFSIRFFDMNKVVEEYRDRFFTSRHITMAAYNRLFIPNIFYQYKRAVYLDCDLIVKADIAELYNIELEGKSLGAVLDFIARGNEEHARKILGDRWTGYFNSGVLVFDVEKLLKNDFFDRCMENMKNRYIKYLETGVKSLFHDQDTLNAVCVGDTQLIDGMWNVLNAYSWYVKKETQSAFVVHYVERVKPWNTPTMNAADIWWSYAIKTPFYDKIIEKNNLDKRELERRLGIGELPWIDHIKRWFGW